MLATTLGRHRRLRSLEDLQQGLLHALTRHVAGDRRVLALARHLVDLVDVDDARLGPLHVEVGRLDQLEQDVLDVLADVAGLGERGGVGDGERHVELTGQRLREVGLAAPGGAEEQDVRLGKFDLVASPDRGGLILVLDPPVVVVDGDRQDLLRRVLSDDVVVEERADLAGIRKVVEAQLGGFGELFLDDLVAQVDALVADVHARACDQLLDLLLRLAAERALQQFAGVPEFRHCRYPCRVVAALAVRVEARQSGASTTTSRGPT